jgi:hypothetical protein
MGKTMLLRLLLITEVSASTPRAPETCIRLALLRER